MRLRTIVPTVLVAAVLTACGALGDTGAEQARPVPDGSRLELLPPTRTPSGTARPAMPTDDPDASETSVAGDTSGEDVDVAAFAKRLQQGADATTGVRSHTVQEIDGVTITTDSVSDRSVDPPSVDMTLTVPGAPEQRIALVDGAIYSTGGDLPLEPGRWMQSDPDDPDDPYGQFFGQMLEATQRASTAKAFVDVTRSVTFVGIETVDAEPHHHYELSIDAGESAAILAGEDFDQTATDLLVGRITQDVWLDDQDRIRVIHQETGGTTLTVTNEGYDEDITIEAPNPADVIPFADLAAELGG